MTALSDLPIYEMVQKLAVDVTWTEAPGSRGMKHYGEVSTPIGPLAPYDHVSVTAAYLVSLGIGEGGWRVDLYPDIPGRMLEPIIVHRPVPHIPAGSRSQHWPSLAGAKEIVGRIAFNDGWADIVAPDTRRRLEDGAKLWAG